MRLRRKKSGFLLVELVVATVVIAGGLVLVAYSFHTSQRTVLAAREYFRQSLLAQSKLAEIETIGDLSQIPSSGNFSDHTEYSYRIHSKPVKESDNEEIELEIFRTGRPEKNSFYEALIVQEKAKKSSNEIIVQ